MSSNGASKIGTIGWVDLTVPQAEAVRDFYSAVVGWKFQPVSMGEYDDFNMMPPQGDTPAAGICHARGQNAGIPPRWIVYIYVANLEESMAECERRGGRVVHGPIDMGEHGRYCIIEDPAGAVAGLFQAPEQNFEEKGDSA